MCVLSSTLEVLLGYNVASIDRQNVRIGRIVGIKLVNVIESHEKEGRS